MHRVYLSYRCGRAAARPYHAPLDDGALMLFTENVRVKGIFQATPKQLARWEKIRAKGMWRFVLLWGVIGYGGPVFLIAAGINLPFEFWRTPGWFRAADLLLTFLIMCPVVGGLWGFWMWHWAEKRYLKQLNKI
ncbi:MAG: hypothetical protein ACLP0A_03515 [Verrucomicrobiia bacterium]